MTSASELLSRARAALERGDVRAALEELIAAWQQVRAPRLGDFIDWLSRRLDAAPPPEPSRWVDLAEQRDPLALPGLLATLTAADFREAERRADALISWDDPRISTGLLTMLGAPRFKSNGAQWFYGRVFKVLEARRDPRVPPALRALADRYHEVITNSYGPQLAKELRRAADAMQVDATGELELTPLLDALEPHFAAERADAERAKGRRAELSRVEAEVRARALAHPDDDGHFLVWADVLSEQGDPRGELMSLQLLERKSALAPEQLEKLRLLQSRHRDRLLGAIAPSVVNAVFERGVAVHVELGRQWQRPEPGAAEWLTVRGVTLPEQYGGDEWATLLAALPRLQDVLRATPELLATLHQRRPELTLAHVLLQQSWTEPPASLPMAVTHLAAREARLAPLLRRHEGTSVTLEAETSPDDTISLLEKARARWLRGVDGVHLLEPMGWYGWCVEFDAAERLAIVRGRFSGAPDFARLDAWLRALERLRPREVKLDESPQRDALYLPLRPVRFAERPG
ncbi:MAG: TIGR02996 domain-containing protein [Myxococcota bacterium]